MSLLRAFSPRETPLLNAWVEDVRRVLTAAIGGLSWRDNIGPVVDVRYIAANAPIEKRLPTKALPWSLFVLRAVNRTDQSVESGCRIVWSTRGDSIRIVAIDVSDTNDEYDVTIGLLMG